MLHNKIKNLPAPSAPSRPVVPLQSIRIESSNGHAQVITIRPPLPEVVLPKLHYLAKFTSKQLDDLRDSNGLSFIKDHKKSVYELEKTLALYWKSLRYYQFKAWMANASIIPYFYYLFNTSTEGFASFIKAFDSEAVIPETVNKSITMTSSFLSTAYFAVLFSAYNEAVRSTLIYAYRAPFKQRLREALTHARSQPRSALTNSLTYIFNKTVLLNTNLTGTMSEIVDIIDQINSLPAPLNWFVITTVLYCGDNYYDSYMTQDYFKGLHFWLNKENHPWLLGEIRRGNFAKPLQILLQGISAIGLRTYPLYYYLTFASEKALGAWFPLPMVLGAVTFHSLCTLYPDTYHRYMDDEIIVSHLIKEKMQPWIEELKKSHPHLPKTEIDAEIHKQFNLIKNEYKAQISATHVLKEPMSMVAIACRLASGGYLGWRTAALLAGTSGITFPILGMIGGGALLGGALYQAEANRLSYKHIRNIIEKEKKDIREENKISKTCHETVSDTIADTLNISNGISSAMSTIGTSGRTASHSSVISLGTIIAAIECSTNAMQYSKEKTRESVYALIGKKRKTETLHHNRLFSPAAASASAQPIVESKLSFVR